MPTVKIVTIYAESHLPKNGWFQACIVCETITSETRLHRIIDISSKLMYEIHPHICPYCKKNLKNNNFKSKYTKVCNQMIDEMDL